MIKRLDNNEMPMHRAGAFLTAFFSAALLAGCATAPATTDAEGLREYQEANDPLEPLNRAVFAINQDLDLFILRPLAVTYRDLVPDFVKDIVRNFLDNLRSPVTLANNLLQGDLDGAGNTLGRFLGNSLIGVGGAFDVMQPTLAKRQEDFGQTLGVWGIGEGPYLVLPVLGPSPVRDTVGMGVDYFLDPINWYVMNTERQWINITRNAANGIDIRSRNIAALDEVERSSLDYYAAIRSLYRQRRDAEIRNNSPTAPKISARFDFDDAASAAGRAP